MTEPHRSARTCPAHCGVRVYTGDTESAAVRPVSRGHHSTTDLGDATAGAGWGNRTQHPTPAAVSVIYYFKITSFQNVQKKRLRYDRRSKNLQPNQLPPTLDLASLRHTSSSKHNSIPPWLGSPCGRPRAVSRGLSPQCSPGRPVSQWVAAPRTLYPRPPLTRLLRGLGCAQQRQ